MALIDRAYSTPIYEYVIEFTAFGNHHRPAVTRTVRVRASCPRHARCILRRRYPRSGDYRIISKGPVSPSQPSLL